MSRQYWEEALAWITSDATAVANTVTETILVPNVTVPGNLLQDGRFLIVRGYGKYGTTGTPTLTFTIRLGGVSGTVLAKSAAMVLASGEGGGASMTAPFSFEAIIQCRVNGSSGKLMTNGDVTMHADAAATAGTVTNYGMKVPLTSGSTGGSTPAEVTADLTADAALSVTVTWGTANAANSIQCQQYYVRNPN